MGENSSFSLLLIGAIHNREVRGKRGTFKQKEKLYGCYSLKVQQTVTTAHFLHLDTFLEMPPLSMIAAQSHFAQNLP